jgi:sialic acid synthase SpsE
MCTAFSPQGVEDIDPLVRRHKIASSEMEYSALLQACLATEKPVLISTGGHTLEEIRHVVNSIGSGSYAILYCCNAYPSRQHNLFLIDALRSSFPGVPVGFSDHTIDVFTPFLAATYFQAPIIEKHVTLSREMGSPDAGHSITFPELQDLVRWIRQGKCDADFITPEQWPAVRYHNRRKTENGFCRLRQ